MRLPWRRPRTIPGAVGATVPDDVPRSGFFTEPVHVDRIRVLEPFPLDDGRWRAAFQVRIRDAEGRRCSHVAVEATLTGPDRAGTGQGTTDLMGQLTFRMAGPAGRYEVTVDDVAAGGLAWDRDGSVTVAAITVAEDGRAG